MQVITRHDRGYRKVGGGVIDAFEAGRQSVALDYDFIAKMDVNLEFSEHYLEKIMVRFAADPKLAAASGKVFRPEGAGFVEEFMIDEMVAGQFKPYRRQAFEKIGGFVRAVMWDGIDFHKARLAGYRTRSFPDPELQIVHLRLMGSSDKNVFRGRLRHGRGQWFMGTAFPYMMASGLLRMREKPYVIGGLLMVLGYLKAAFAGEPRYEEPGFGKALRRWQYARLRGVLTGHGFR